MEYPFENRLNGCQIFGWLGFEKPNPNRFSVFHTPVIAGHCLTGIDCSVLFNKQELSLCLMFFEVVGLRPTVRCCCMHY